MFRTRDFILYFTVIVFLLVAIGFTVFEGRQSTDATGFLLDSSGEEISNISANVVTADDTSLSREERLRLLREKIKESDLVSLSQPTTEEPDVVFDVTAPVEGNVFELLLCNAYNPLAIVNWPVAQINMENIEGARQYFTEQTVSIGTSSSSTVEKTVLLTLPTNFVPFGPVSCLSNDIIGVALDGSLIRNNETNLYSIFSSETLIGYALDGFPIYGLGNEVVDECGGRISLGQYRYELSAERPTIINCFADSPRTFE